MNKTKNSDSKRYLIGIASIIISLLLISLQGCSKQEIPPPHKPSTLMGYSETGLASYYAMKYQFRKTASGERFSNYDFTAAHKKLPFGTWVKVTNLKNNENVTVRINDRGPFVKGRIIDLTRAAFSEIGNLDSGILKVKVEVIR